MKYLPYLAHLALSIAMVGSNMMSLWSTVSFDTGSTFIDQALELASQIYVENPSTANLSSLIFDLVLTNFLLWRLRVVMRRKGDFWEIVRILKEKGKLDGLLSVLIGAHKDLVDQLTEIKPAVARGERGAAGKEKTISRHEHTGARAVLRFRYVLERIGAPLTTEEANYMT